ncbi:Ankyrin repeat and KH domain-containing protein mask [Gryllus bimaculatus]|nr:Ankyrin repeat and KH domain-containing protein mask [Gryllus bimaculatus]
MDSVDELLFNAVTDGDANRVSCLLAQGANVNIVCSSGRTALGSAAETGNLAILKLLLDASGINVSVSKDQDNQQHHLKKQKGKKSRKEAKAAAVKTYLYDSDDDSDGDMPHKPIGYDHSKSHEEATSDQGNDGCEKNNLGYFIMVHGEDGDENLNLRRPVLDSINVLDDLCTPDGMEKLEWDVEVEGSENAEADDDSFTSLYRWYADILDRTGSLLQNSHEFDVNHQDVYGRSAVHYAAEHGHLEALRLLSAAGCKLDIADTDNFTPLHLAVARDHVPVVKMLVSEGAQVNRKTSDKTSALHMAASRGHIGAAEVLLGAGASVDALDSSDRTPLLLAVSRGHEEVVQLLLHNGAKVNIEEIHGYTPLCEAVWKKAVPLVQMLLDADAKVTQSHYLLHDAVMHRHLDMVRLLVRAGCIVNLRDENGDTPLIVAARTGHIPVAELLLENGACVNYANSLTGSLPLHEAVDYIRPSQCETFEAMFKLFLTHGAALDVQTCTGGDSPLFRAVLRERPQAAAILIRHGADVNVCSNVSCVVDILTLALMRDNFPLVRMLVYAGFNLQKNLPDTVPQAAVSINAWLHHMRKNAMRLTDLCRISIRRMLRTNLCSKISRLYLPVSLKSYLMLEDVTLDD